MYMVAKCLLLISYARGVTLVNLTYCGKSFISYIGMKGLFFFDDELGKKTFSEEYLNMEIITHR